MIGRQGGLAADHQGVAACSDSEVPASEFATRSAFKVLLEGTRLRFGRKRNRGFDSPRAEFRCVTAVSPVVISQAVEQLSCDSRIMRRSISFANQDVNVEKTFQLEGLPSRSLGAPRKNAQEESPPSRCSGVADLRCRCAPSEGLEARGLAPAHPKSAALPLEILASRPWGLWRQGDSNP